jgi:hypothetical protein
LNDAVCLNFLSDGIKHLLSKFKSLALVARVDASSLVTEIILLYKKK